MATISRPVQWTLLTDPGTVRDLLPAAVEQANFKVVSLTSSEIWVDLGQEFLFAAASATRPGACVDARYLAAHLSVNSGTGPSRRAGSSRPVSATRADLRPSEIR